MSKIAWFLVFCSLCGAGTLRAESLLLQAVLKGDKDQVEMLLEMPLNVNEKDQDGKTILHHASELGHQAIVGLLVGKGADLYAGIANSGWTALHLAAEQGHADVVQLLLEQGVPVDLKDHLGETPLYRAAENGHADAVQLLLEKGADPAVTLERQRLKTPLHMAAINGHEEVCRLLLKAGAPVEAVDSAMNTPLLAAAGAGRDGVVKVLIEAGADIEAWNREGQTALYLATAKGYDSMFTLLLSAGADRTKRYPEGKTLLHVALKEKREPLLERLLPSIAVNVRDFKGQTVLHEAVAAGNLQLLKKMLQQLKTSSEAPLLHELLGVAVQSGWTEGVKYLLDQPVSYDFTAPGQTFNWRGAVAEARVELLTLLLARGVKLNCGLADAEGNTPLHYAVTLEKARTTEGPAQVVSFLLENGATINARNVLGETPLCAALKNYRPGEPLDRAIRLLLVKGAHKNLAATDGATPLLYAAYRLALEFIEPLATAESVKCADQAGMTPLHWLVSEVNEDHTRSQLFGRGDKERPGCHAVALATKLLLSRGAVVNAGDGLGRTPLHLVACEAVALVLLEANGDLAARDAKGRTPLHWARGAGIAALLLDKGAAVNAVDDGGNTPLHVVLSTARVRSANEELVTLLMERGADLAVLNEEKLTPMRMIPESSGDTGRSELHLAAMLGYAGIVGKLLDGGQSLSLTDGLGRTPLHLAAVFGQPEIVALLIKQKAGIDAADKDGNTPLHLAMDGGRRNRECVELLVGAGADLAIKNGAGVSPLDILAKARGCDESTATLALQGAAAKGYIAIADRLIKDRGDLNDQDKEGKNALYWAIIGGNPEMVAHLIELGAKLDATNAKGRGPLHWAMMHENCNVKVEIVRLLVAGGAKPGLKDKDGLTPLDYARIWKRRELADALKGKTD